MSINRVVITGNLTRDAELRSTASGTSVLGIGVAVNDRRRNPQGEWEDYPNFIDCTMFGTRAEKLQPYLTKGTKVAIEGKLRWSQWERDGQKRSKIEVIVDDLEFMSSRNSSNQGGNSNYGGGYSRNNGGNNAGYANNNGGYAGGGNASYAAQRTSAPQIDSTSSVYDEDIPF